VISALTNTAALRARNTLADAGWNIERSLHRLATGRRINSAADDPAGLVAVTHLESAEADIHARIKALEYDRFYADATEGGLSSVSDLLLELDSLTVQAANDAGLSRDERSALQVQADSILATLDYLGNGTEFNGARILSGVNAGTMGSIGYTTSVNGAEQAHTATLADLRRGGALDLINGNTEAAQRSVRAAMSAVSTQRAALGARSNGIDTQIRAAQVELENTAAAKGAILDTDYAQETATLAREQTRQQAALAVTQLAQRQRANVVLDLLKSLTDTGR